MSAEEDAYQAALDIIAMARDKGQTSVDFDTPDCHALRRIPPELATLTRLQTLRLSGPQITDLAPLATLTGLQTLLLGGTQITDLAPLATLNRLQDLWLEGTQITALDALVNLTGLLHLGLGNTLITDFTPLANLTGLETLVLQGTQITDLAPLATLNRLQALGLEGTRVADIAPLGNLTRLESLWLQGTQITDLRPIRDLPFKWDSLPSGLSFGDTPATARDAELARMAGIEDDKRRTRDTLAYLKTLPPWPQPYTPRARPDGKPPQPIGGDAEHEQTGLRAEPPISRSAVKVRTSAIQIKFLLREPQMTQTTAQGVAEQIRVALREVRSRTNDLPEALLALEGVAEALQGLGAARIGPKDKNRVEELQLRIAHLEASLEKLTEELKAAKAAKASDGFGAHFSKEAAGEIARTLGFLGRLGAVAGAVYFIGPNNPIAASFIAAWAAASKLVK
ncbi:MAG: hypothetical protein K9G71_13905 [Rhodobacteraceae bacterium]|nr:hypothetical protein [Paracoccaceae bacterium]MCF8515453.1 hypothetical protein [Paracoccaceae bacterium]MCF8519698.1 hypothetical protein [Paracoccaceae bacterium]